ncbi:hypothetical protein JAAARDRAFT_188782 [Jaapia argillacea MUCL 33604]|uniref:WLM domain-containing protein n=1 Tax=Jaapia argillacea MUCL 33604 TaxID=933084 RepID=A0A067QKL8_9AGAM|nr:hypothetical protein JAAARDRAFT_188782 [Jaapia argillacea MUCL 33604]
MSEIFVQSFTHLKDRPKADQALPLLQKVASLVKPIMRKHSWHLPLLAEFFPESPNLIGLNVNGGEKILLRLRPAWAPDTFYDIEDIVHTMLHELTHNVHGPHDEKFYKFLSGLEDEHDALKRSGYSGEGFYSKGTRLGAGISHDLPPHMARQKALEAAEKRRKLGELMSGGRRLGGASTPRRNMTPRELAAEAAERRAGDEKACGYGLLAQQEAAKAARDSVEDKVIDLTGDSDGDSDIIVVDDKSPKPLRPPQAGGAPSRRPRPNPSSNSVMATKISGSSKEWSCPACTLSNKPDAARCDACDAIRPVSQNPSGGWSCATCTLLNEPGAFRCEACDSIRPSQPGPSSGWTCAACGGADMPHDFWTCTFCGTVKTSSSRN